MTRRSVSVKAAEAAVIRAVMRNYRDAYLYMDKRLFNACARLYALREKKGRK
jgi:hypothetical protein